MLDVWWPVQRLSRWIDRRSTPPWIWGTSCPQGALVYEGKSLRSPETLPTPLVVVSSWLNLEFPFWMKEPPGISLADSSLLPVSSLLTSWVPRRGDCKSLVRRGRGPPRWTSSPIILEQCVPADPDWPHWHKSLWSEDNVREEGGQPWREVDNPLSETLLCKEKPPILATWPKITADDPLLVYHLCGSTEVLDWMTDTWNPLLSPVPKYNDWDP